MNHQVADIALKLVLPLGITFTAILQSAAAYTRSQKILGVLLSILIVAMDCVFYFAKNTYITYNCDGGLLLTFASMVILSIIYAIRSEDRATMSGNIFLAVFMLAGFLGIAYWDRPTFIPTSEYNPRELAEQNARYQDYIASFENGDGGKAVQYRAKQNAASKNGAPASSDREFANSRLESYVDEAESVIRRMLDISNSIDVFEPLPANISESEREIRSQQALAINNNAVALNKKVLGLFHPHESSEAHSELIQASESARLAAYSLYNYTLQDNPEEQLVQYRQTRSQIAQMNVYLDRFRNDIENLKSNNKPQPIEQQDQQ
ncbi:MAG: hypothetical protein MJZ10_07140 [Fibrobacter sp.]|nr:hypothetical protein [Fibrobacter sp.]